MHRNDVQHELAEGFEPGPLPPMGPDGGIDAAETVQPLDEPPPRLCEQGPCIHYHRFEILMDAAKPRGERVDDTGRVIGPPPDVAGHLEIHHYCYPNPGIETVLGSLPVVSCNRWTPIADDLGAQRARDNFLKSLKGEQYRTKLDQWRERQRELADAEALMYETATREIAAAEAARAEANHEGADAPTSTATTTEGDTP